MRIEASAVVDRGQYQDAVTPWERGDWRGAALDWVAGELAARGLGTDGHARVRLRPWSVLMRVPVAGRRAVWFKANPPETAFEGALTAALARWMPEHVLEPLAVDAERGWSLLPDGGELFRDLVAREAVGPRAWEEFLLQYAALQRALVGRTQEILRLGVPDARTPALPEVLDRLVATNAALRPDERTRLRRFRPRVEEWCAELAAVGIADSLDHSDLHDGQLFRPAAGRYVFFDWGDAAVSHPFCSLPVAARSACERYGPGVLPRLRDAYLEPWTGEGRTTADLRRAVSLAWRLAALGRAGSWVRLFPAAGAVAAGAADTDGAAESAHWLLELFSDPPL